MKGFRNKPLKGMSPLIPIFNVSFSSSNSSIFVSIIHISYIRSNSIYSYNSNKISISI